MQAASELVFQLGYYPWITQNKPPEQIRSSVELFASAFEKALQPKLARAKVVVTNPVDVPQQIDRILANERTIELMICSGFVFGQLRSQKIEAVAEPKGKSGDKSGTPISPSCTHLLTAVSRL